MAKPQTLKADARARTGSGVLKQMRREGYVPSVIYGGGSDNKNVKIDAKILRDMLKNAASDSILVNLDVEGDKPQLGFLQDIQHNALTGEILHVDFLAVDEKTEINANIPLELVGEPAGVKAGGVLEQMLYSLEVRCLPKDLPETLSSDVSEMEIGDIHNIGNLNLPEGVSATLNDDVVIGIVAKTRVAKSAEGAEEGSEPEASAEKAAEA